MVLFKSSATVVHLQLSVVALRTVLVHLISEILYVLTNGANLAYGCVAFVFHAMSQAATMSHPQPLSRNVSQ